MNDLNTLQLPQYLSTRETAKKLQISLGTVQKMVEMGELVAWKTRGGHRRILKSSLEQLLNRRQTRMRDIGSRQCRLLGLFKREENRAHFTEMITQWDIKIDLITNADTLEALMQAVELTPDIIYIDALISPVEQVHLIHYLSKNTTTRRIPLLIDEGFLGLHPGVIRLAAENAGLLKPGLKGINLKSLEDQAQIDNPMVYCYPATTDGSINPLQSNIFEKIIQDILAERFCS
jgi:excisionase family DNA binding protein